MLVSDDIRKCVAFIGYKMANGDMRLAGTAFYLGNDDGNAPSTTFLVTARHLIDGIRKLGLTDIYVRLNTVNEEARWVRCEYSDWRFHPSDSSADVAIQKALMPADADHLVYPLSRSITNELLKQQEVGLGDEVFIVGLFRHHHGERRNIPIVRIGNLSAMLEEKVQTKNFGLMDAYLIEARSIGGLSGSPVLLNLGVVRSLGKQIKHSTGGSIHFLMGLVHGHFDVANTEVDDVSMDDNQKMMEQVNTGIAIVVPMHKIRETIDAHVRGAA